MQRSISAAGTLYVTIIYNLMFIAGISSREKEAMSLQARTTRKSHRSRRESSDAAKSRVYSDAEKQRLADEFSPALAEVLETVAEAWGNKVRLELPQQEKSADAV